MLCLVLLAVVVVLDEVVEVVVAFLAPTLSFVYVLEDGGRGGCRAGGGLIFLYEDVLFPSSSGDIKGGEPGLAEDMELE